MMNKNRILCAERIRRVPKRFSWVDHRLLKEGYVERCGVVELTLYLILVIVGDRNGVSFYSDRSLCALLKILPGELSSARNRLQKLGLIAWEAPFYQILSLDKDNESSIAASRKPTTPVPATALQIRAIVKNFNNIGAS